MRLYELPILAQRVSFQHEGILQQHREVDNKREGQLEMIQLHGPCDLLYAGRVIKDARRSKRSRSNCMFAVRHEICNAFRCEFVAGQDRKSTKFHVMTFEAAFEDIAFLKYS